jgi:HEAT repeat protein
LSNLEPNISNLRVELVYLRDNDVRGADIHLPALAEVEAWIESAKKKITKEAEYLARPGWYCKMCRFKTRCSLDGMEDESLIFNLKFLAEDDSPDKRAAAAFALGNSRQRSVTSAVVHALRIEESRRVRREAARALERWQMNGLSHFW